ncbi:hypothetical protein MA16_Dca018412 [Dendrobium catenatum]|uniref:Uncharacterized protein n=1 Tax=Dendrobium catenatum TaxID=906689 RepID=A0A2I0WHK7_9ASPA|nr:hypothetical protein MA16_Dca018412 [Dendrobium catenatum]
MEEVERQWNLAFVWLWRSVGREQEVGIERRCEVGGWVVASGLLEIGGGDVMLAGSEWERGVREAEVEELGRS